MALFENYDRRIDKINGVLKQYGIGIRAADVNSDQHAGRFLSSPVLHSRSHR